MGNLRKYTWIITLVSLALLLLARTISKRGGGRRAILVEHSQGVQADAHGQQAGAPGDGRAARQAKTSKPVAPLTPVSATLRRTGRGHGALHGRLVDAAGAGLADVTLRFVADASDAAGTDGAQATELRTGRDGRFQFDAPYPGHFKVTAGQGAVRLSSALRVRATPGTLLEGLTLHATAAAPVADGQGDDVPDAGVRDAGAGDAAHVIAGSLRTTPEGAPLQAAVLEVKGGEYDAPADTLRRVVSVAADGHFALPGFAPGTYRVQAYATGRAPSETRITLPMPVPAADLTLSLGPGGDLHGKLLDGGGAAVADATLTLTGAYDLGEQPVPVHMRTRSAADGGYRFAGIGSARVTLVATLPDGREVRRDDLRLFAGQSTELVLKAPAAEPASTD